MGRTLGIILKAMLTNPSFHHLLVQHRRQQAGEAVIPRGHRYSPPNRCDDGGPMPRRLSPRRPVRFLSPCQEGGRGSGARRGASEICRFIDRRESNRPCTIGNNRVAPPRHVDVLVTLAAVGGDGRGGYCSVLYWFVAPWVWHGVVWEPTRRGKW